MRGAGYELFAQRRFRDLFGANLLFNLCLVMLLLGISWTMTSLTDSPTLISLVQTVMSVPFLVFAVPFGIAADRVGHRTVLFASQVWLLAVLSVMGVIALADGLEFTPTLLLSMTFLVGIGVVAQQTAWKPFMQDFVPKKSLSRLLRSTRSALMSAARSVRHSAAS